MAAARISRSPSANSPLPICRQQFALPGAILRCGRRLQVADLTFLQTPLVTWLANKWLRSQRQARSTCATRPLVHAYALRMYAVCSQYAPYTSESCAAFRANEHSCAPNAHFLRNQPARASSHSSIAFGTRQQASMVPFGERNLSMLR